MNPSQAINLARKEMGDALIGGKENVRVAAPNATPYRITRGSVEASETRYVWQNVTSPGQDDPWGVHMYGPDDQRPYYVIRMTGSVALTGNLIPVLRDTVELFNRPDYARATIWDRILGSSDPPRLDEP